MHRDFGRRELQSVFTQPPPQASVQGITAQNLKPAEKQASFVALRELAGRHRLLPEHMKIAEKVSISDDTPIFGVFADVRYGMYEGRPVAVKAMRVTARDDFVEIRKVSINAGRPGHGLNNATPAIFRENRPLEHTIPPEHPEARWGPGGRGETPTRSRVGVDVGWEYYGVH